MEPGGLLPHGSYPDYVSKGFFVPQSDNIANCGLLDAGSIVPANLGNNTVGGGKRTRRRINRKGGSLFSGLSALSFKPWMSQNPPTTYGSTMAQINGALPFPGGQAHETTYKILSNPNVVPPPNAPAMPYNTSKVFTSP
jgi:hypothetical protein